MPHLPLPSLGPPSLPPSQSRALWLPQGMWGARSAQSPGLHGGACRSCCRWEVRPSGSRCRGSPEPHPQPEPMGMVKSSKLVLGPCTWSLLLRNPPSDGSGLRAMSSGTDVILDARAARAIVVHTVSQSQPQLQVGSVRPRGRVLAWGPTASAGCWVR